VPWWYGNNITQGQAGRKAAGKGNKFPFPGHTKLKTVKRECRSWSSSEMRKSKPKWSGQIHRVSLYGSNPDISSRIWNNQAH
jgi:hypothetical protein